MRSMLTTIGELSGLAAIAAGCWQISAALGLIVGGASVVVVSIAASAGR